MSSPYGPSAHHPGRMNNVGGRLHFPQTGPDGKCAKKINPMRDGRKDGSRIVCGQSRDGDRHLHYACTVDEDCGVKSWSLEARANHERLDHR